MKKFLTVIAASMMLAGAVSAQNLGGLLGSLGKSSDILGTVSKVVYAYTGNTNAVSLPGNWTYTGSAISLGGDNALSNVAGTAVSSGIEGKVDGYLQQVGLKAGVMKFTFNEDLTFTCTIMNVPITGTWKTLDDGKSVQLQFGKTLKFFNMTGALEGTPRGCKMLFNGKKFLSFVKTALAYVGKQNETAGAISSLAGNYNNMKIGFALKKN